MSIDLNKMTVPELKKRLISFGLPLTGRKADLLHRLQLELGAEKEATGTSLSSEVAVEEGRHTGGKEGTTEVLKGGESGDGSKRKRKDDKTPATKRGVESSKKSKGIGKRVKQPAVNKCVESCKPGKNSGCPIKKGRGKTSSQVGCADVDEMLEALGVNSKTASLCTKAAIMKGHIKITGGKGDLDQVVVEQEGECGHVIVATLEDLLQQPDYAGLDYEDGCENATVICKECNEGRTYVTTICEGKPSFDSGKFHNHCNRCPGFGKCIHDYREAHCDRCGGHYFAGVVNSYSCSNCKRKKRAAKYKGAAGKLKKNEDLMKIAMALVQGEMPPSSDDSSDDEF